MGSFNFGVKQRQLDEEQIAPHIQLNDIYFVPEKYTKTVHFIRHGEGFHNVAGALSEENYKSYKYFDAHLTETGWKQAAALKHHVNQRNIEVDLVIVSPMSRALETAVGVFGGHDMESNGMPPLMVQQKDIDNFSSSRAAVSSYGAPPFLAVEMAREQLGRHPCDKRRTKTHLVNEFPGVDFSLIEYDEDVYYDEDVRETREEIQARGLKLIQYIFNRPEKRIAVVAHAGFLRNCFSLFGNTLDPTIKEEMQSTFKNCEMRSITLSCHGSQALISSGVANSLDFSG